MALPTAAANGTRQVPVFVNMISLLLSSTTQATSHLATPANTPATTGSPAQVAAAMIRSMLSNLLSESTAPTLSSAPTVGFPVSADAQTQRTTASPAPIAESMMESMWGELSSASTVPSPPSAQAVGLPVVADGRTQLAMAPSEQIVDSAIQSMLTSPSLGSINSSAIPTVAMPAATDARKQLRSVADLPVLTAIVEPMQMSAMPIALPVAPSSHTPDGPTETVTATPQLPSPAVSATPLVKSEIAFTALLTPIKDSNAPVSASDVSRQTVASPVIATNTLDVFSPAAIAPVLTASNFSQPPVAQSLQTQAAVQATGKTSSEARSGGDLRQGGDAPSEQEDDSTGTPAQVIATADAKLKAADIKLDDNGIAGAAQDRIPVADASLTSFPDQASAGIAIQANSPATEPTPFHSTAEALRTSEPELPAAPQLHAGAAQEISIRIAQPDATTIDLRVVERSGQLHVDVRSSDSAMQSSLRQDLGTLTNSLDRAGYHSEIFTPFSLLGRAATSAQMSNRDDHQDRSQDRGGAGVFSGGRRQQQQKRPSTWLEEMEDQQ